MILQQINIITVKVDNFIVILSIYSINIAPEDYYSVLKNFILFKLNNSVKYKILFYKKNASLEKKQKSNINQRPQLTHGGSALFSFQGYHHCNLN